LFTEEYRTPVPPWPKEFEVRRGTGMGWGWDGVWMGWGGL